MTITVVITDWCVPFDQVVREIKQFKNQKEAVAFINKASKKWWDDHEGDRCVNERPDRQDPYEPITELGYDMARYELWGGEQAFHAMLDNDSYARLHEAHYKREYDDKGVHRPGYLLNAYADGMHPAGKPLTPEQEAYRNDQLEKIQLTYGKTKGNC